MLQLECMACVSVGRGVIEAYVCTHEVQGWVLHGR
jgi:hypothetical protein